jgi:hypothetical protein
MQMQETSKEVKLATGMDDMSDDEDMDLLKATDIDAYWLQVPPPAPAASTLRTSDPAYRDTPCGTAARCAANSHRHAAQRVPNSQLLEWAATATANHHAVAALTHMPPAASSLTQAVCC